jgi:hypothetical protein
VGPICYSFADLRAILFYLAFYIIFNCGIKLSPQIFLKGKMLLSIPKLKCRSRQQCWCPLFILANAGGITGTTKKIAGKL